MRKRIRRLGTKSPYLIPPFVNWGQRGFFLYERGKRKRNL
jgi:hypothetical protein